ncbi:MAG TPA: V-type ATP synthase subunit K, partial [Spirochaetia bacterium]|nr:V-type ATP synthase subunit K [Spirochaetia bacterium]
MNIGMIGAGAVMALSAIGSGIGAGIAGQAAIGAWKRNYLANKPASFLLMIFAGAPLTQTIYGFILMGAMMNSSKDPALLLAMGLAGGAGMAMSAVAQGKASAASCDAFGETGKGFANYITIVG